MIAVRVRAWASSTHDCVAPPKGGKQSLNDNVRRPSAMRGWTHRDLRTIILPIAFAVYDEHRYSSRVETNSASAGAASAPMAACTVIARNAARTIVLMDSLPQSTD